MAEIPHDPAHNVEALNFEALMAFRADGVVGKITNLYDGQEATNDPDQATSCVIGWPDGLWSAVDLSFYEKADVH